MAGGSLLLLRPRSRGRHFGLHADVGTAGEDGREGERGIVIGGNSPRAIHVSVCRCEAWRLGAWEDVKNTRHLRRGSMLPNVDADDEYHTAYGTGRVFVRFVGASCNGGALGGSSSVGSLLGGFALDRPFLFLVCCIGVCTDNFVTLSMMFSLASPRVSTQFEL